MSLARTAAMKRNVICGRFAEAGNAAYVEQNTWARDTHTRRPTLLAPDLRLRPPKRAKLNPNFYLSKEPDAHPPQAGKARSLGGFAQEKNMENDLGQPTAEEIAEKFCTEMLCNALLCDGCPVQVIQRADQQERAVDDGDSLAESELSNDELDDTFEII